MYLKTCVVRACITWMWAHLCVQVHIYANVWEPDLGVQNHLESFGTLFTEADSLNQTQNSQMQLLLLASLLWGSGGQTPPPLALALTRVLGIQSSGLFNSCLNQRHLSRPLGFFFFFF